MLIDSLIRFMDTRIVNPRPKSRLVTWRGGTLVVLFLSWSAFVYYLGYDKKSDQVESLQVEVEKVNARNALLVKDLVLSDKALDDINAEYKSELDRILSSQSLAELPPEPDPKCKPEDAHYGRLKGAEFIKKLNEAKKELYQ